MPGVATMLNLYPSDSVVVVVMTNRDNGAPAITRVASLIAGIMLPRYIATRDERRAAAAGRPPEQRSTRPDSTVIGTWKGFAIVLRDSVPVTLEIAANGSARLQIGADSARAMNGVSLVNGWFSGGLRTPLRVGEATPEGQRGNNAVQISLRARNGRLTGWAAAIATGPPNYGAVSYRLELKLQ
jgi:hypothetical protein